MEVNIKNFNNFINRLDEIIRQSRISVNEIEIQISKLQENSNTEHIVKRLRQTARKLSDQLITAQQMKNALSNILETHRQCEEDIGSHIECSYSPIKVRAIDEERIRFIRNIVFGMIK